MREGEQDLTQVEDRRGIDPLLALAEQRAFLDANLADINQRLHRITIILTIGGALLCAVSTAAGVFLITRASADWASRRRDRRR